MKKKGIKNHLYVTTARVIVIVWLPNSVAIIAARKLFKMKIEILGDSSTYEAVSDQGPV